MSSCHTPALCLGFLQRASGEAVTTPPPLPRLVAFSCSRNVYVCVLLAQLCPALCDPMDYSPLGSSVHGISQGRILEWVAIPFFRGPSWPRDQAHISCDSVVKNPSAKQEMGVWSLGGEDPLIPSSTVFLPEKSHEQRKPGRLHSLRLWRGRYDFTTKQQQQTINGRFPFFSIKKTIFQNKVHKL